MEQETKLAFGKILGEMYRIQKEQGIAQVSDATIFGLLNGFEESIDGQFSDLGYISKAEVELVADYFAPYWKQEKSLDEMPNYKSVEMSLERKNIHPAKFAQILKYLYANERFVPEIDQLGRSFKLSEYDI